jgi:signal transduction histidine kinase
MPLNLDRAKLKSLVSVSIRINQVDDLSAALQEIADTAAELTQSEGSSILLFEEETQQLYFAAARAKDQENLLTIRVPIENSVAGQVYQESRPLQIKNAVNDRRIYREIEQTIQHPTRNLLAYPITFGEETYGTLEVINKTGAQDYGSEDQSIIEILASYIGTVLHIQKMRVEATTVEEERQELEKQKSNFIAITSHELRTPLGLVLGHATFLKELIEDEFYRSQLDTIVLNAERLKGIIEGLSQVENFDSGTVRIRWQTSNLNALLEEIVHSYHDEAQDLGITLGITVPETPINIQCDAAKLKVAIGNIFKNGLVFSDQGQNVQIGLRKLSGFAHISIIDSGIGIATEHLHRIFDRFYQVEPHLTRTHGGMGLGLPVSKAIIESHGGHIWVESELGKGSTFTILLPVEEIDEAFQP